MNIREHLENLTQVVKAAIKRESKKSGASGSYSHVAFGELDGFEVKIEQLPRPAWEEAEDKDVKEIPPSLPVAIKTSPTSAVKSKAPLHESKRETKEPVRVAVSKLHRELKKNKGIKQHIMGAHELLGEMTQPHGGHMQATLAYDEDVQVYLKADDSLLIFLEENPGLVTLDLLSDFAAQLVVIIDFLHKQNITHLDIHPKNILVTFENGIYKLRLGDIPGIAKGDAEGKSDKESGVTEDFLPKNMRQKSLQDLYSAIAKTDRRKLDCYALGAAIQKCIEYLPAHLKDAEKTTRHSVKRAAEIELDVKRYKALKDLASKLQENGDHPPEITSIEQIKQHEFFGITAEKRAELFSLHEDAARQGLWSDNYYVKRLQPGDYFYLLPPLVKEIYFNLEKLESQLAAYNKADKTLIHENDFEKYKEKLSILRAMHESIRRNIDETLKRVNEVYADTTLGHYRSQEWFLNIKKDLDKEKQKFLHPILPLRQIDYQRAFIAKGFKYKSKVFFETFRDELIAAFDNMAGEYVDVNQLGDENAISFFSRHGLAGKRRVQETYNAIKNINENYASNPEAAAIKIFQLIYDFLNSNQGNWRKNSSKTLLVKYLKNIPMLSDIPLDELYNSMPSENRYPFAQVIDNHIKNISKVMDKKLKTGLEPVTRGDESIIYFGKLSGFKLEIKTEEEAKEDKTSKYESDVPIVFSELRTFPDEVGRDEQIDNINDVHRLIAEMKEPHFGRLLSSFYFNRRGKQLFLLAEEGDLEAFIKANPDKINPDSFKNMVAQLVSVLEFLHNQNIVHLDVKHWNILVSKDGNGLYRFRLGDLAGMDMVDPNNGHRLYMAPDGVRLDEKSVDIERKAHQKENKKGPRRKKSGVTPACLSVKYEPSKMTPDDYRAELNKKNLKAEDCYALGRTLEIILDMKEFPAELTNSKDLRDLINQLKQPNARIDQAKDHQFFGEKPEREKLFLEVQTAAQQRVYSDDYYVKNVKPDDYFYVLPTIVKEIYFNLEKLKNELAAYEDEQDKFTQIPMYNSIRRKFYETLNHIDKILKDDALHDFHEEMHGLKQDLMRIDSILIINLISRAQPVRKIAFEDLANNLSIVFDNMVSHYIAVNGLENDKAISFFALHGKAGKQRVLNAQAHINAAIEYHENNPEAQCKAVFEIVDNFLNSQEGNRLKTSSKTILENNLQQDFLPNNMTWDDVRAVILNDQKPKRRASI